MTDRQQNRDRIKAAAGVAAFHLLLGYALVTGLGYEVARQVNERLRIFDVTEPVPPRVEEVAPTPAKVDEPEGAAAPPNIVSKASPVVAPPPEVKLVTPPPVIAAPVPGTGSDRTAGAADTVGPGTGAGGVGTGTGAGGEGSGTGGGGGGGTGAERVSGSIQGHRDYPRESRRAGVEGTVVVRFTVEVDGSASNCTVIRSSANAELEATTCRLIEQRFRYRPARDAAGNPVPEVISRTFDWLLPRRR